MESKMKCPKCGGEMEEGFTKDVIYGGAVPSNWIEGEPEKSIWGGTKTKGKLQVQITTYRCIGCGYLESYAK